jgi:hypothetical protein
MRIGGPDEDRHGPAIDLRDRELSAEAVAAAIAEPEHDQVTCAPPEPIHEFVGVIQRDMSLDRRCALAAAGRSRGLRAPQADAIERLNDRIAEIDPDSPDLRAARRRVAETGSELEALRERVERTSGRLAERRATDRPTAELEERLADLTRELTEVETEAIAAREALSAAQAAAAEARDAREERLTLVDRRENRRREARRWFCEALAASFERALTALPIDTTPAAPDSFDGPDRHAGLAIVRLARLSAPVVLVDPPFQTAVAARAALDAPVILTRV